mmetsp:Transcript_20209/g.40738  ORF Transcript_20209/g.40738 Transcript_20209/m.40738 type:complete len:279 (-) Transcript_20209:9-845(-)
MAISSSAPNKAHEEVQSLRLVRQAHFDQITETPQGSLVDGICTVRCADEKHSLRVAVEAVHPCKQRVGDALVVLRHAIAPIPLAQESVNFVEKNDGRAFVLRQCLQCSDPFLRVAVEFGHDIRWPDVEKCRSMHAFRTAELRSCSPGEHSLPAARRAIEQHAAALSTNAPEEFRRACSWPQNALPQHELGLVKANDLIERCGARFVHVHDGALELLLQLLQLILIIFIHGAGAARVRGHLRSLRRLAPPAKLLEFLLQHGVLVALLVVQFLPFLRQCT